MMADAFIIPALVIATGLLVPLGLLEPENLQRWLVHPLGRAALFVLCSLTFFHAAHRLRFALADLGLKPLGPALAYVCYGGAILGTLAAALVALGIL
jgi:fumarate reductase subunit D